MRTFDYATACKEASKAQGIDDLISALSDAGIHATSEQTGGFTMCAYIPVSDSFYIYANLYGASEYDADDYIQEIIQFNEPQSPKIIAGAIWLYLQKTT
jgi:hypothetical protein